MVNVIILAGQRKGVKDSLCLNAGVSHKALVPINGTPMIDFVIKTLLKSNLNIDFVFGWPNRNTENQPYGHWIENGKIVPVNPNTQYDLSLAEPAGDLSMNIDNYTKFIQLNIKGLSKENEFLNLETYNFLHTAKDEYAIGWGNYTKNDKQISEHAGSDGTFFCYAQIDRKTLIGYVVIANSGTQSSQNGVFEMINELKKK